MLSRRGHTEATIDLVSMAGFKPAGVLCELTNDDGSMAHAPEVIAFAKQHDMVVLTIRSGGLPPGHTRKSQLIAGRFQR